MYSAKTKILSGEKNEKPDMTYDEACTAFFNWKDAVTESAKEYSERVRKMKLLSIFRSIIENELTPEQKETLVLKYFDEKNGEEIASLQGTSRSTVSRSIIKTNQIIKTYMKYVFEYADTEPRYDEPPLYIEQAVALMARDASKIETAGQRMKAERERKLLSTLQVSECTGVPQRRLESFENGGNISLGEFSELLLFYKMSADKALFGV